MSVFNLTKLALLFLVSLTAAGAADVNQSVEHDLAPLSQFKDCDACPEMIVLPLGSFRMGGPPGESRLTSRLMREDFRPVTPEDPYIAEHEGPVHSVQIDIPIAIGRNEVTFSEWEACVADGGCGGYKPRRYLLVASQFGSSKRLELSPHHPVNRVSYDDIQLYIAWLNKTVGSEVYRLPTEAEWEFAARAGTQTPYAQGEEVNTDQVNFLGWMTEEMLGEERPEFVSRGHPVRVDDMTAENAWGIRHMSGNLSERTSSCWTDRHQGFTRSSEHLEKLALRGLCKRVSKGGDFSLVMDFARPAARGGARQEHRSTYGGFRVVRELKK